MKHSSTNEHIHTPMDGRGPRKVFVNGNEIPHVFYADTKKGIVRFSPEPIRIKKNSDYVYSRVLKGEVTVEEI